MVNGRTNNVINVYTVIIFLRTDEDKKQLLHNHYGINMFMKNRPMDH